MTHDIVIRGGSILDGSGSEAFLGDLAIDGAAITEVGEVAARGRQEIDADGLMVSPGFIDLHTHFDAQVYWDPDLTPASWHGVTTALMGNCGVTFAPCRPGDREFLADMMARVEDIPRDAILGGIPWSWEDYGGYLDAVETVRPGINLAGLMGHSALRYYVMGERSFAEQATDGEIAAMADLVSQAMKAGALGVSTNRHVEHRVPDGRPIPGTFADISELRAIGETVAAHDGLIEFAHGHPDMLQQLFDETGVSLLNGTAMGFDTGVGQVASDRLSELCKDRDIMTTTPVRGSGLLFGLQSPPRFKGETWDKLRPMTLAERLSAIEDEPTAAKLAEEGREGIGFPLEKVHYLGIGRTPDYGQPASQNVLTLMAGTGETFARLFLRLSRETEGRCLFNGHHVSPNIEEVAAFIRSPYVLPGVGDAGAHLTGVMDGGWATFVLSYWVRQRRLYTLPEAVRRMTSASAQVMKLKDRGVLAVGKRADVNVFDPVSVVELQPQMVRDFPCGALRYIQRAEGYKATIVNGQVNVLDDQPTGARAGTVLRHLH